MQIISCFWDLFVSLHMQILVNIVALLLLALGFTPFSAKDNWVNLKGYMLIFLFCLGVGEKTYKDAEIPKITLPELESENFFKEKEKIEEKQQKEKVLKFQRKEAVNLALFGASILLISWPFRAYIQPHINVCLGFCLLFALAFLNSEYLRKELQPLTPLKYE